VYVQVVPASLVTLVIAPVLSIVALIARPSA
jgi:hypothetical protein